MPRWLAGGRVTSTMGGLKYLRSSEVPPIVRGIGVDGCRELLARAHQTAIRERTGEMLRLRSTLRQYFPAELAAKDTVLLLARAPRPAPDDLLDRSRPNPDVDGYHPLKCEGRRLPPLATWISCSPVVRAILWLRAIPAMLRGEPVPAGGSARAAGPALAEPWPPDNSLTPRPGAGITDHHLDRPTVTLAGPTSLCRSGIRVKHG